MQVSVENTGGLERRVTVQIPEAEIQQKVDARLQELSKQVKIKGFRPGRVPMSVIRQRYGKQVRLEIANETMQSSLQQAIRDEQLRLASMPRVAETPEDFSKGDLQFTAIVEVYPEIGDLNIAALQVEKPQAEVTEADVDAMIETLREQRRTWEQVSRTPQTGDQVVFDFAGEADGVRVPEQEYKRLAIVMGSSGFDDLEGALSGLQTGGECEVELTFPENFSEKALAGKAAKVELKVTGVAEPKTPEVDEDFIRGFGIQDGDQESLRTEIRANLERELKQAETSILKVRIIDALVNHMPELEIPASIVKQEAASLAARAAGQDGREAAPEDSAAHMESAAIRVRGGLLMGEVARQNKIRVDGTKVRAAIESIAQTYEDPAEVIQLYYGNQQLVAQVENSVLEEQVVDWVLENATVSPTEMKFQEVISTAANIKR